MVSFLVTILNAYIFVYKMKWEDLQTVSSYFNESPLGKYLKKLQFDGKKGRFITLKRLLPEIA